MDSIKKKMISLTNTTEEAYLKAARFTEELDKWTDIGDKHEEHLKNIQKKIQSMEGSFDVCTEQLFEVSLKLEEKEKAYNNTEGEVDLCFIIDFLYFVEFASIKMLYSCTIGIGNSNLEVPV